MPTPEARTNGCTLQPTAIKPPSGSGDESSVTFPSNPWVGTDSKLTSLVRELINGAPQPSDGQKLRAAGTAALDVKLVAGIREAYRAVYSAADGSLVEVLAITWVDEKLANGEPPTPLQPLSRDSRPTRLESRLVRGATVVMVSGAVPPNDCFMAIEARVGSVK